MKTMTKNAVLLVMMCTLFISCKEEKQQDKNKIVVDWDLSCVENNDPHKIDNGEAIHALRKYKEYINNVKDTLDKDSPKAFPDKDEKLNYGSEVDFDLLLEVLAHREFKCEDKLFLMNGIRPKLDNEGNTIKGEFVTEIIFVLESKDSNEKPIYKYFDFTRPCPNGCPKNIPTLEYPPKTS